MHEIAFSKLQVPFLPAPVETKPGFAKKREKNARNLVAGFPMPVILKIRE